MLLFELFDAKPVNITWEPTSTSEHKNYNIIYVASVAKFRLGDETITVHITKLLPYDKDVEVEEPLKYFYRAEVSFTSDKTKKGDVFGETNSKKALAVLNGVMVAIKEYLDREENNDVQYLLFSTDAGKGRASVYAGIIKRRLKQYLPSATVDTISSLGDQIFKIYLNR